MKKNNFNKLIMLALAMILSLSLLAGCSGKEVDKEVDGGLVDQGQNQDLNENSDEDKEIEPITGLAKVKDMDIQFAEQFSVVYLEDGYKLITDSSERNVLIIPEGKELPEMKEEIAYIKQPIKSIGTTATLQPSWLRPINEIDKVATVAYPLESWYIDEIIGGLEEGRITFVGKPDAPDYELIQAIEPEVTFISTSYNDTLSPMYDELGLGYLMFGPHLETDPRGRIEWVKLTGALFNKEEEAETFFNGELEKLKKVEEKVGQLDGDKLKVASSYFSEAKEVFYVRNQGDYQIRMFEMAGGDYLLSDLNPEKQGNTTMTAEEFYKGIENADILIYDNVSGKGIQKLDDFLGKAEYLGDIKAIKEGNVWGLQPVYWQAGESLSDIIEDLYTIFTSPHGEITETRYFFLMQ